MITFSGKNARGARIVGSLGVGILVTAALASCGLSGPRPLPDQVLSFATALQDKDFELACSDQYIHPDLQEAFVTYGRSCPLVMSDGGEMEEIPPGELSIDPSYIEFEGTVATVGSGAVLVDGEASGGYWKFATVDGEWLLLDF